MIKLKKVLFWNLATNSHQKLLLSHLKLRRSSLFMWIYVSLSSQIDVICFILVLAKVLNGHVLTTFVLEHAPCTVNWITSPSTTGGTLSVGPVIMSLLRTLVMTPLHVLSKSRPRMSLAGTVASHAQSKWLSRSTTRWSLLRGISIPWYPRGRVLQPWAWLKSFKSESITSLPC